MKARYATTAIGTIVLVTLIFWNWRQRKNKAKAVL